MSYNFVVVAAAPWSEELLEEFQALAEEASTKTGSATFEISEDLRKALFKIKGQGRIANRKFIEIKNSFSGQNTEKTISFLAEPLEKFKAFLQACFRDNKYQQPTQRSDHSKQIKTERATSVHTEPSFPTAIESPYTPFVKLPPLFNLERMAPTVTSTPHNVRRLTMVTNEGIHFPGCPEFNEAPADTLQKPSDDILRGSDQIIIISLRESKKRGLSGNINHVWVEDISIIPLPVGKALSIAYQDNKIYTLSPSHIEVLEDNKFTQIPCLLKSLKHFLPMKNGDFITTSLLDDQWWISIHRSSGAIASICAANLTIIALTGVTPTTAAFLPIAVYFF